MNGGNYYEYINSNCAGIAVLGGLGAGIGIGIATGKASEAVARRRRQKVRLVRH